MPISKIWNLDRLKAAKVTFKVTQGHWYFFPFDRY